MQPQQQPIKPNDGKEVKHRAIFNKNAGKTMKRKGLVRALLEMYLAATKDDQSIYETGSLEELEAVIAQIHADRPDIVTIGGGDGTFQAVVTALIKKYEETPGVPLPPLLPLGLGTQLIIPQNLKVANYDRRHFLNHILAKVKAGVPCDSTYLDTLHCNDEYGFMYGAGMPVHFLDEYYKGEKLGPRRALGVMASVFWDETLGLLPFRKSKQILTKPIEGTIHLPEQYGYPVRGDFNRHTGIFISTMEEVGLGCRAMPGASRPRHFLVRSSQLSFWGYMRNIHNLRWGGDLPHTFDAIVPEVRIEYLKPTKTTIDGEYREERDVDIIKCGPRLRFITG